MEKKKNSSSLVIITILLMLLVLGLGGYIIYDKILSKEEVEEKLEEKVEETETKENEIVDEPTINKLTDEEAFALGKEMWEYAYSSFWGGLAWEKMEKGDVSKCKESLAKIKQKFASDFKGKESCAQEPCAEKTIDEFLPLEKCESDRGGNISYKETKLALKSVEANKIVLTATSTYCNPECSIPEATLNPKEEEFIITKQNDTWLISYFYLPN